MAIENFSSADGIGRGQLMANPLDSDLLGLNQPQRREVAFCLLFVVLTTLLHFVPVHRRDIPYQQLKDGELVLNQVHNEIFTKDTVSNGMLFVVGMLIPLGLQLFLGLTRPCGLSTSSVIHKTLCVYFAAHGVNSVATQLAKNYCGYLRPSFYQLCAPDENFATCTTSGDDARKSFPSGHSSFSFCGMTLLTMFIHRHYGMPRFRQLYRTVVGEGSSNGTVSIVSPASFSRPPGWSRFVSIVALVPMGVATFVAASRVHDNNHFPADVVAGSVLGASIAIYTNSLWFDEYDDCVPAAGNRVDTNPREQ